MKIGYARVSTASQNLESQIDSLRAAGCEKIYEEKMSGKNVRALVELENCVRAMRHGDTLVVCSLDRLGRSLSNLLEIVTNLEKSGVSFVSLREGFDTTTATGLMIFQIFGSIAEFERNLIRERTMAGLQAARARGRLGGRPASLSARDAEHIKKLLTDRDVRVKDIAKQYRVSVSTIYNRCIKKPA
jgi:DNA invertase Pin-like site-specific DNA recombinase